MIQHPRSYTEPLSTEDADAVLEASLRVLGEVGMVIQSDEARARLSDAGARIEQGTGRVRFPSDLVQAHLRSAPSQFLLHARNPARSVEVGGDCLLVSPGYGSAFVADSKGKRRYAVMEDVRTFARLAGAAECIGITGGLLVEPSDVAPELRPLEMTRVLLTYSDKPFFGSVAGAEGAQDSIEMARIAMGDLSDQPTVLALININSPLRLDARMADALLTYVKAGQPILLTPGILMGVTAPVTPAGALVQGTAELIGGVTLAQVVRPGAPVIIGIGGFGADMRTGGSGFGRPENALGTLMGAQMARRLDLPYRCSAATTGSMLPDCRSGYERMMTALCGWNAGAHVCLQAAGILDCINSMCYEQFVIDIEIWEYITRVSARPTVNADALAFDTIASEPGEYLSHEHTITHFRDELYVPKLAPADVYESWTSSGGKDVVTLAQARLKEMLTSPSPSPLDRDTERELREYIRLRRRAVL